MAIMTSCLRTLACTFGVFALAAPACQHGGRRAGQGRAADSSPVVARAGDAVITVADVQKRIDKQPPFVRARYADPAKRRELVDELVQQELLAAEAARHGYGEDPAVQRAVKQQMISRMVQSDFESKLKVEDVPDADVQKYYDEHAAEFHQKDAVGVRAIVVKNKAKADRAYAEAQGLPKGPASLEQKEEQFQELVEKDSDVRDTKAAADLLSFSEDSTVVPRPIVEAAFKLRSVGEVAPPIKTDQGWAVILLTQKRPGISRPLPEVKRQIQQRLFRELHAKALNAFVEDAKKKSHITITEANLSKVVVEAGAVPASAFSLPGALGSPIDSPPATSAPKVVGEHEVHR
jgi:peptidyl-prolyl cis-trans isomerase C